MAIGDDSRKVIMRIVEAARVGDWIKLDFCLVAIFELDFCLVAIFENDSRVL